LSRFSFSKLFSFSSHCNADGLLRSSVFLGVFHTLPVCYIFRYLLVVFSFLFFRKQARDILLISHFSISVNVCS
jgi:hypothetical protein